MKRLMGVIMIVLLGIGLVGCSSSLVIEIDPSPMDFYSGDDLIDGTITVSVTGFGSLTIDRIVVEIIEKVDEGTPTQLFYFNTEDHSDELGITFPISSPIAFEGLSETFSIQDDLLGAGDSDGYTINDMILEISEEHGITSYEQLKGKAYALKVTIDGTPSAYKEVEIRFN